MSDLRATAIHEAGHAVAHVRLRLDHAGADIIPRGDQLGGAAGEGINQVWDKAGAGPVAIAMCAGYAARIAAGHSDAEALEGTGQDFEEAQYLIDFWCLADDIEAWKRRAVELMCEPSNKAAVALVAEHLLEHKRLDGDFVDVLVEVADGDATEADLARYLQFRGIRP